MPGASLPLRVTLVTLRRQSAGAVPATEHRAPEIRRRWGSALRCDHAELAQLLDERRAAHIEQTRGLRDRAIGAL